MKVAITGAAGHVGGNLVRALIDEGRKVKVLVRNDTRALEGLNIERVQGNIFDKDSLVKCFTGVDTVFHCAAMISIDSIEAEQVYKTNIEGPKNVVEACLEAGVKRLVHVSSIHAYSSNPSREVIDENRPLADGKKHHHYDRSKALGQKEILKGVEKGLDAVIINPTGILGPNDFKKSRMGAVLLDLYHGTFPMIPEGGYNWVDVRDVVSGALSAEKNGRKGQNYLITGRWASFKELASIIHKYTGKKTFKPIAPYWTAAVAAPFSVMAARIMKKEPLFTPMAVQSARMHRFISHLKAADELGYRPRPLEETVRDTMEWFKEHGMLNPAYK